MARGDIVTIANGATALRPLADAAQSLVVNNRNNGLVYVAADEQPTVLFFDYIVPPNSSARLPGVFRETVGVLYQDLTGAGTAGQVELYRSNRVVDAPEYGPLGASATTSFANVDLAQVATPSAPASGFSRLFASAVDQQLWYELPNGALIPVSQQAKLQLWSVASTDLVNGLAAATGAWTDLTSNTAFSTVDAASLVEVSIQAAIQVVMGGTAGAVGIRLSLDNNSSIADLAAKFFPISADDFVCGNAVLKIDQLATGTHNLKLQYFAQQAATLYLRAASTNFEFLRLAVVEHKR